jgi:prepilin-type processing-associated H-X9-DG protein
MKKFTLVELLIVVSIIALLISLLLPSLKNARHSATLAVCLSTVSQSARASMAFAKDFNGRVPSQGKAEIPAADVTNSIQINDGGLKPVVSTANLGKYMGLDLDFSSMSNLTVDIQDKDKMKVFQCPADPYEGVVNVLKFEGYTVAETFTSFASNSAVTKSVLRDGKNINGFLTRVYEPDSVGLYIEGKRRSASKRQLRYWTHRDDLTMLNLSIGDNAGWKGCIPNDRHSNRISTSFVDGHAMVIKTNKTSSLASVYLTKGLFD